MPPKRKFNLSRIVTNVQPEKRRKKEEQNKENKRKANERQVAEFGVQGAKRVRNMNQYGSMRGMVKRRRTNKSNTKNAAVRRIQLAWKKKSARLKAEKNKLMNEVGRLYREGGKRRRVENKAATKIQKRVREQLARRRVEKNKLMNEVGRLYREGGRQRRAAKKNAAARRVQRAWKRKSARLKAAETIRDRGRRAIWLRRRLGAAARNYPRRMGWDAVDVFRNSAGIVRVRRRSNGFGTKKRWVSKLKPKIRERNIELAGGEKEYMTAKHGEKHWHRYRPRGRYESTTRCEYIAPKSALLKVARARGTPVRSKNTKKTICAQMANVNPMGTLNGF